MNVEDFISTNTQIINRTVESCDIADIINAARSLLYPLGDWSGTMEYGAIPENKSCVVAPYEIETIRSASAGCKHVLVENNSFCFISEDQYCECGCSRESITLVATGRSISLPAFKSGAVRFIPKSNNDYGRKIRLSYITSSGSEVAEEGVMGENGYTTKNPVSSFKFIRKDRTEGTVGAFHVEPLGKTGEKFHTINPRESTLSYSVYSVKGCSCECIIIYGKKRFIPYSKEDILDQELDIAPHALALAIKALDLLGSGAKEDINFYQSYVKLAVEYLKAEKKDKKTSMAASHSVEFPVGFSQGSKYDH